MKAIEVLVVMDKDGGIESRVTTKGDLSEVEASAMLGCAVNAANSLFRRALEAANGVGGLKLVIDMNVAFSDGMRESENAEEEARIAFRERTGESE